MTRATYTAMRVVYPLYKIVVGAVEKSGRASKGSNLGITV